MTNSGFRCQGCKTSKPNPPHRRLGLGGVCSSTCFDIVQARRNKSKTSSDSKPKSTKPKPAKKRDEVPEATRIKVRERDGGRCRFCGRQDRLHCHHINLRAQGVDHQEHNLITLCTEHHDLVHTDTKYWRPILLAVIWYQYINGVRRTVRQAEFSVDKMLQDPWARLFHKRRIDDEDNWLFTGSTTKENGYGRIQYMGKLVCVHVLAWELTNGPVPPGMKVLHTCDVPPCFNPQHLFLGSQQDNVDDMVAKGRDRKARGSDHGTAKLTEEQVVTIRQRRELGAKAVELANEYGVTPALISHICTGRIWKHVGGPIREIR